MKSLDSQLDRKRMTRALSLKDLQDAHEKRQPIIIQAVEGGHFVEDKPERVTEAYRRGLRVLGLLHDDDTSPPLGGHLHQPAPPRRPDRVRTGVIRECNRLAIRVDLTHASDDTVAAAIKVSTRPMIFSHAGPDIRLGGNPGLGRMMRTRLINKAHAKSIADAGGLIGCGCTWPIRRRVAVHGRCS